MIKISGLDTLTKQLEEAEKAIEQLEGELSISFDPNDPASIEAAIQEADAAIDSKAERWAENPLVAQVVCGLKEQYRQVIIDRAAAARLEASDE
jgi:hypothetical protein